MEIDFHYIRRITGLLAANSKADTTKKVRETGRFAIPEFDDADAPVAFRSFTQEGNVQFETRWRDGSHWYVTNSVPPEDGQGMAVDLFDYDLMYGDLLEGERNIMHGTAIHGYVPADKKWHRVASDDALEALDKASAHFTNNTAIIGGKFAYRVLEPSFQFFIFGLRTDPPYKAYVELAMRATVESRRWYRKYGLSVKEHREAAAFLIASANLADLLTPSRAPEEFEVLIPEAFTDTLVEPASRKVLEDGLSMIGNNLDDLDLKSKIAFTILRDGISRDGRLTGDSETALANFAEFGDVLRDAKIKNKGFQDTVIAYIDFDLRVTIERLKAVRALDNSPEAPTALRM
jgi:hypothetical protein